MIDKLRGSMLALAVLAGCSGEISRNQLTPIEVTGLSQATAVTAGAAHSCAVRSDGTVSCWGNNARGQLGDGSLVNRNVPVQVKGLTGATAVVAGVVHTCALLQDKTVSCWGDHSFGQLGAAATANIETEPVKITGISTATAVVGGDAHSCALLEDKTVQCWGENASGQLGDGQRDNRVEAMPVIQLADVKQLAAGDIHSCALLEAGTVKCWGENDSGQLGDGTMEVRATPVEVKNLTNVVSISAGGAHTCAVLGDGTARCWGFNDSGQLGNGDRGLSRNQLEPVVVDGLSGAATIAAGYSHTCAILTDGSARCWGSDVNGQVGDGTGGPGSFRTRPAPVIGLTGIASVTAGGGHSCAVLSDGSGRCWGFTLYGRIGNATLPP